MPPPDSCEQQPTEPPITEDEHEAVALICDLLALERMGLVERHVADDGEIRVKPCSPS